MAVHHLSVTTEGGGGGGDGHHILLIKNFSIVRLIAH